MRTTQATFIRQQLCPSEKVLPTSLTLPPPGLPLSVTWEIAFALFSVKLGVKYSEYGHILNKKEVGVIIKETGVSVPVLGSSEE